MLHAMPTMIKIRKILSVTTVRDDFVLECVMESGEVFNYDMSFLKDQSGEMVVPLKEPDFFKQVFLELGHLSWPNGYEVHANTVAQDGVLMAKAS